jgi:hypothetical protein
VKINLEIPNPRRIVDSSTLLALLDRNIPKVRNHGRHCNEKKKIVNGFSPSHGAASQRKLLPYSPKNRTDGLRSVFR